MQFGGIFRFQGSEQSILKEGGKGLRLFKCREQPETSSHLIVRHTLLSDLVIGPQNHVDSLDGPLVSLRAPA